MSIFEQGASLPAQKSYTFTIAEDGQKKCKIHLLEGDADFVSECRSLGQINVEGYSIGPRGAPQIAVTLSIEKDGTLSVDAAEQEPQGKLLAIEAKTEIETVSVQTS